MGKMTRRFVLKGLVLAAFWGAPFGLAQAWADTNDYDRKMREKRDKAERERKKLKKEHLRDREEDQRERRKTIEEQARERRKDEREKRLKQEKDERKKAPKQFKREREDRKRRKEEEKDRIRRTRDDFGEQSGPERAGESRAQEKGLGLGKEAPGRKHPKKNNKQKVRRKYENEPSE